MGNERARAIDWVAVGVGLACAGLLVATLARLGDLRQDVRQMALPVAPSRSTITVHGDGWSIAVTQLPGEDVDDWARRALAEARKTKLEAEAHGAGGEE